MSRRGRSKEHLRTYFWIEGNRFSVLLKKKTFLLFFLRGGGSQSASLSLDTGFASERSTRREKTGRKQNGIEATRCLTIQFSLIIVIIIINFIFVINVLILRTRTYGEGSLVPRYNKGGVAWRSMRDFLRGVAELLLQCKR